MLCWQQDSLLLTGPGIYPQVYHRTPCPVELICKGSLIKNKGRIGLFKISQKERLFYLLYNQMLLGIISQCGPTSCALPRKVFLSPSVWARREYIRKINWKKSLLICFENRQGVPCFHWQSGNRMMNTVIIVNITPICNR